jgi:hypothetical protein
MFADFTAAVVNIVDDLVKSQRMKRNANLCTTRILVHLEFQMRNVETLAELFEFRDVLFHYFISPYSKTIVEAINGIHEAVVADLLYSSKDFKDGESKREFTEGRVRELKLQVQNWQKNAGNAQPDPKVIVKNLIRIRGQIAHGNNVRHHGRKALVTMIKNLEQILNNLRYHIAIALPRVIGVGDDEILFLKADEFPAFELPPYNYP